MELAEIRFDETKYYFFKDGSVYRIAAGGVFKENWSIHRKVGKYKIHTEHFNTQLPCTKYYLIDTESGVVFCSEDCHFSMINEIVNALKSKENI